MGRRLRRPLLGLGAVGIFAVLVGFGSLPSWTISTSNATNGFGAGTLGLSDTVAGTTCAATAASPDATCGITLAPATVSTTPSSVSASVTSTGTLGAHVGISAPVCGLAQAQDATSGADTMIAHGGITYQTAGPLGGTAIAFDGTTGYFGAVDAVPGPQTFTETAWFETTGSGSIMSFANVPGDTGATSYDRMLWVDPAGHVVAGVYPGATDELVSPKAYNNGAWNFVAVTLGPAGFSMYVNGRTVRLARAVRTAQPYTGYWHIGWSNAVNGWPRAPGSAFFSGSLAGVGIFPTVLTGAQLNALYASGSMGAYSGTALSDGPSGYWGLQDTGLIPYTGPVPGAPGGGMTYPDLSGNGNTATVQGGSGAVTPATTGPLGAKSLTFNGTSGWLSTSSQMAGPQTFTEAAWFETTGSGSIFSFANIQGNTGPTDWDRMLWVDPAGHVVAGVYPGSTQELVSPASYNNGAWHLAVVTLSGAGFYLYVDGIPVASTAGVVSAQVYSGYWHIGWSNATTGWPDPPTSAFFPGDLAGVGILPVQLSGAQVSALYGSSGFTSYSNSILADTPIAYWPLQPSGGINQPPGCPQVEVTASLAGICIYPTSGCSAPASAGNLAALSSESPTTLIPSGTPETLTLTYAEVTPLPTVLVGVHVIGTLAVDGAEGWQEALLHPIDIELT